MARSLSCPVLPHPPSLTVSILKLHQQLSYYQHPTCYYCSYYALLQPSSPWDNHTSWLGAKHWYLANLSHQLVIVIDSLSGRVVRFQPGVQEIRGSLPAVPGGVTPMAELTTVDLVAALPDARCYRIGCRTGLPHVSILWGSEIVWSAASVSEWAQVPFSQQIHPGDTLACCWYIKQERKKHCLPLQSASNPKHLIKWMAS